MAYMLTYDVVGNREDLTDDIVNVSPRKTYLLSNLPRTKATGRFHEWQTDVLAAASTPDSLEGADQTTTTRTARVRVGNYCSVHDTLVSVSETQVAVSTAGVDNEFEYELDIAMKEHARDWEKGFIQSTSASGDGNEARTMMGFGQLITTNVNTSGAESDYTYARHYALAALIADASDEMVDVLYYKSAVQVDLAAHAASAGGGGTVASVVIQAPTGGVTDFYEFYHDQYGRKKLVPNYGNFAIATATASPGAYQLATSICKIAYLRGTRVKPLAYDGGGPRAVIQTEATLVFGKETAHGSASQLSN